MDAPYATKVRADNGFDYLIEARPAGAQTEIIPDSGPLPWISPAPGTWGFWAGSSTTPCTSPVGISWSSWRAGRRQALSVRDVDTATGAPRWQRCPLSPTG